MVETGQFREDLYYRLGVFVIRHSIPASAPRRHPRAGRTFHLPPRPIDGQTDRRHLARGPIAFAKRQVARNVRELENTIQRP